MAPGKRSYIKTNRPAQAGELVGVRLQPEQLARIDAWRAVQPAPMTRPEAMRALMDLALSAPASAASLLELSDLIFVDGLNRPAAPETLSDDLDAPLPPPEEPWPEDLRDSFIMAVEPEAISRLHEIVPLPKPLPERPLDRLGPLGPLGPSGRGRKR